MCNYIDLFHGIGGFALGAYWAGMKFDNHFCSDIEPYAQKLYKLRFPDSIQLGDITKIDTRGLKKYGDKWIITGGFPCQDISIAGKGVGITGKRSGLWFEYWRLIRDLRPDFAIMENVGALTFRGLNAVLGSLSEIGYNAEWQDIRASDVGAPHRRERIWIVAYPNDSGKRGNERKSETEKIITYSDKNNESDCTVNDKSEHVADTFREYDDNTRHGASKICGERPEKTKIQGFFSDSNSKRLQGRNCGIMQECSGEWVTRKSNTRRSESCWESEPEVGRLANGIPGRVDRLKGLGNSIVPQIAELLFNQIKPHILFGGLK